MDSADLRGERAATEDGFLRALQARKTQTKLAKVNSPQTSSCPIMVGSPPLDVWNGNSHIKLTFKAGGTYMIAGVGWT